MSSPSNLPGFKSLLLLLILAVMMKMGVSMPKKSGCPKVEGNDSLQSIRVNMNMINRNQGSKISPDYKNRSTSPWDLVQNVDENRQPRVIWEARCRYSGCINVEGKVDYHRNSVPIQQEIMVLRRESPNCSTSFRLEKILVTVGCTCVIPRTVP
ncbi:interleukin-17A [Monodelphis domestica]|uniref:interleukin-17A n=1 Tax=Monodelphis domestica TaxID=13616 RepID=UPI0024E204B6|nr:interleukin-17A [Monodelphis domestica]